MTVGLPGVGIGGIFYLVSALLMPFRSLVAHVSGRQTRWGIALRQALIAGLTLSAIWATGWAIGWVIAVVAPAPVATGPDGAVSVPVRNAVRMAAIIGSFGTLTLVLAGVQGLRLVLPRRPTPGTTPMPTPAASKKQSAA